MSNRREAIPWWARVVAKILLARLPIPYAFWKRMGLFEHGDMNQPQRALDTFLEHARTAGILDTKSPVPRLALTGNNFGVLELGPGDSLSSAVIARSMGASRVWLVDAGTFAAMDMAGYAGLFEFMRHKGFDLPFESEPLKLDDMLKQCSAAYLTEGVRSLAQLPSASVDFCFSNAVLEHIPKREFTRLAHELLRILKPDGVIVHRVDLKDHLGGNLNNLRFSEATWEGALFRNSGFYTNRIRFREMLGVFERAGFECHLPRVVRWAKLPIPHAKLYPSFRHLPDEDLLVSGFDIVLKIKG